MADESLQSPNDAFELAAASAADVFAIKIATQTTALFAVALAA